MKIPERLEPLVEQGIVQAVLRPLMSGKEASLFIVQADDDFCVAKVYKDAKQRSFKHRAGYTEGRRVRNSRQQRAMDKGSKYGRQMAEAAWQNAEVDALYKLWAVGVRVPKPHLYTDNVLLMDLVLDADGKPAPRMFDVDFTPEEAVELHAWVVRQMVWMLYTGLVHGDLSECNVLMAWDGPMIIDLPQAVDAASNPNARTMFVRDIKNVTNYLARFAPELAETRFGEEIWSLYERAELRPDTALTGRWKGSDRKADTRAVLREIDTAARDAQAKREADGEAPRRPRRQQQPQQGQGQGRQQGPRQPPRVEVQVRRSPPPPRPPVVQEASPLDDLDALLMEEPRKR